MIYMAASESLDEALVRAGDDGEPDDNQEDDDVEVHGVRLGPLYGRDSPIREGSTTPARTSGKHQGD